MAHRHMSNQRQTTKRTRNMGNNSRIQQKYDNKKQMEYAKNKIMIRQQKQRKKIAQKNQITS